MMRLEPTLLVRRLVIEKDGKAVYDQAFHEGVNILRGNNSSGKSTILNFIFFALGGELEHWSSKALLCTRVFLEVQFNAATLLLSRDVTTARQSPMEMFSGTYQASLSAPRAEWARYPYKRSQTLSSFSEVLFALLGIPEVKAESSAITMHQMLRLLYADQLSPTDDLFRHEDFDPPLMRHTIGRLLCGAYDNTLYQNELSIKALDKQYETVSAEYRSLSYVAGTTGEALTIDWINAERSRMNEDGAELRRKIEETEREVYIDDTKDQITLDRQQAVYARVQALQGELGALRERKLSIELTRADSALFIADLETKLEALQDAAETAKVFQQVLFDRCPSCYAPVRTSDSKSESTCHLCQSPFDGEAARSRLVAMVGDATTQLKQSNALQLKRDASIAKLEESIITLEKEWRVASDELQLLQRLPSSESRGRLRELHRQAGYLQRQLEEIERRSRIIERLDALSIEKQRVSDEIERLKNENARLAAQQETRLKTASTAIGDQIRGMLHRDLRREEAFLDAENIQFDFQKNSISVDGSNYFSASSRAYLKSCFFLALLTASTIHEFFRFPRFLMMDIIEDKGIEQDRSHNFQREVVRMSALSKASHQIIFATSMIAPELDDPKFTIGHFSTVDNPTLNMQ